ncbi:sugar transferase [Succiniclasticum ruminis]
MIVNALIVRMKLGIPVLFTQDRPGKDGKIFNFISFVL